MAATESRKLEWVDEEELEATSNGIDEEQAQASASNEEEDDDDESEGDELAEEGSVNIPGEIFSDR